MANVKVTARKIYIQFASWSPNALELAAGDGALLESKKKNREKRRNVDVNHHAPAPKMANKIY